MPMGQCTVSGRAVLLRTFHPRCTTLFLQLANSATFQVCQPCSGHSSINCFGTTLSTLPPKRHCGNKWMHTSREGALQPKADFKHVAACHKQRAVCQLHYSPAMLWQLCREALVEEVREVCKHTATREEWVKAGIKYHRDAAYRPAMTTFKWVQAVQHVGQIHLRHRAAQRVHLPPCPCEQQAASCVCLQPTPRTSSSSSTDALQTRSMNARLRPHDESHQLITMYPCYGAGTSTSMSGLRLQNVSPVSRRWRKHRR